MFLFTFFFGESATLVSKQSESVVISFLRFYFVFNFNLAERQGLFHGEHVSLYVLLTISVFLFSKSENVVTFCCSNKQVLSHFTVI